MNSAARPATVESVSLDDRHRFSKSAVDRIVLLTGLGVQGDAHAGATVQHRSRVAVDPMQPNLRQVHLMHSELFAELRADGYDVSSGQLGENITTRGIDLLALPRNAVLEIGDEAVVRVTGLRNPCAQINAFRPGLLKSVMHHDDQGAVVRKAGVMGIVLHGGTVRAGDAISVSLPHGPHLPLERV
jgi:MOSC domain-containing protein YiiM